MKYKFIALLLISPMVFSSTQLIILGSGTPNPDPERSNGGTVSQNRGTERPNRETGQPNRETGQPNHHP